MSDKYNTIEYNETTPLTYNPHDILELMMVIDPYNTGFEPLVRSLYQACAGVPRAKKYVQGFIRHTLSLIPQDPYELDDDFEEWWSDDEPAIELRDLARNQAESFKNVIFDFKLSDNHPTKIEEISNSYQEIVDDLETWIAKPRKDFLAQCTEEYELENWYKKVRYEVKNGSKNAKLFLDLCPSKYLSSEGQLYVFMNHIWNTRSDKELEAEIRKTDPTSFLDVDQVTKMVKGIHQWTTIKEKPYDWLKPEMYRSPLEDLCLFNNGIYNLSTGELLPHDGSYFATGLPNHDYNPFAECPNFMKWLEETLDPSFHKTLQQYFGYCLIPDIQAHKFMTFVGATRSGKSTANNILKDLVGSQHVTSAMMPDLGSDFGMMKFLDKRLVIIPDAHDAPTKNRAAALERIKSITGGDDVAVNRKYLPPVSIQLKTRLLITCNRLPKFIDESGALAARMLIIRFSNSFKDKEDCDLGNKLKAEMSGIANWALSGLKELRSNEFKFTVGELGKAEVKNAQHSQSPALRFIEDYLIITGDDKDFTPMPEIYLAYKEWIYGEGLKGNEIRNQNDLAQDIVACNSNLYCTQRRVNRKQTRGIAGVKKVKPNEYLM